MKTALLLVDIQNDYFPGGKSELVHPLEALHHAKALLNKFREKNQVVIHVQHISLGSGAAFFLPDTEGAAIHDDVKPLSKEYIVQKHSPNSFQQTDLSGILQKENVGILVICGMMTHMCIDATVRAARDLGYRCVLVEDACATKDLKFRGRNIPALQVHQVFLAALDHAYAEVVRTNDIDLEKIFS